MSGLHTFDDHKLLSLLQDGNASAFDVLYNRYWDRVLSLAFRKTGDLMEAENIVQDVFVSLWKRRDSLHINGDFSNYLFIAIKYRVLKTLAKKAAASPVDLDSVKSAPLTTSPHEYLEFEEIRERLEMVISQLPEKSRLVYQLKNEDKSYKEIAAELNLSEKAVDAHLLRVRRKLRTAFGSFLGDFLL
ncbi:sigma-70 family RNA polymerase sigma factor [uncultured Chitinophaga sp.]|jgi:RNA polymerase sigma factor, sigma-70 family|uniref:RNA polymerase sigma factor n=1 Tax=uncultured Chitinophaga sp. TaxID=339340 RepID=UPI0026194736|nr:sigma-70 family RNA polymerase sigma factor [uncultured Chitinophaga sp.]